MRLLAALLLALAGCEGEGEPAPTPAVGAQGVTEKPTLALLTSLPLVFAEDGFALQSSGSSALDALEAHYDVQLIAAADADSLAGHDLLLMAHAPAQTAEGLVELDAWVEQGGRVLVLADPRLVWESSLSLGDRRRPLLAFPDTGLLGHWGLRLDGPVSDGPQLMGDGETSVLTAAPGALVATGAQCSAESEGFVALCEIDAGKALIIADADFIMLDEGGLDGPTEGNLPFLISQLQRL